MYVAKECCLVLRAECRCSMPAQQSFLRAHADRCGRTAGTLCSQDTVWQNRDPLEQCQRHLGTCEWHSLHRAAVANRQTLCLVASALPHIHVHMGQQFPHQPYFAQRFASDGHVAGFVHVCWVTHTCTHSSTPATTSLTRYVGMYVHG
jgi:hypothetical protein